VDVLVALPVQIFVAEVNDSRGEEPLLIDPAAFQQGKEDVPVLGEARDDVVGDGVDKDERMFSGTCF
jgi:hypothetical protein